MRAWGAVSEGQEETGNSAQTEHGLKGQTLGPEGRRAAGRAHARENPAGTGAAIAAASAWEDLAWI